MARSASLGLAGEPLSPSSLPARTCGRSPARRGAAAPWRPRAEPQGPAPGFSARSAVATRRCSERHVVTVKSACGPWCLLRKVKGRGPGWESSAVTSSNFYYI